MKVGFIGLGGIGKPMAINIAKSGFDLTVTDLREPVSYTHLTLPTNREV